MDRRSLLAAAGALLLPLPALRTAAAQPTGEEAEVDLLLVLAADVSHSMQARELRLQRDGYAQALSDPQIAALVGSGPVGAIALTYMEWSGQEDQRVLVPWTRLADAADANRIAAMLAEAPQRSGSWTSIAGALAASRGLIARAPFHAPRMVIDVSGDGENNNGGNVTEERDRTVAEGIVVNGLPILRQPVRPAWNGLPGESALEAHYRQEVIGGGGAFLVAAEGFDDFAGAIRRKLVMEIAGSPAAAGTIG